MPLWHKKKLGKIISAGGGRTAILPTMSYAIDIVMVIIIFLFILTIIINILNYRIVKRRHYMVALIAENARVGFLEKQTCQIPEFDNDLVRRLIASIKVVSVEKLIIRI